MFNFFQREQILLIQKKEGEKVREAGPQSLSFPWS
jgi:hypothetical protein